MSGSARVVPALATALVAVLLAACGAVGGVGVVGGVGGVRQARYALGHRYTDPAGWSLTYPGTMQSERSGSDGMLEVTEVTIASFVPSAGVQTGGTRTDQFVRLMPPVGPTGTFPRAGVALRIILESGGPPNVVLAPDARFPIGLATFRPSELPPKVRYNATTGETVAHSQYRGVPPSVWRSITADGSQYTTVAWIGRSATPTLRAALAHVIASLSFPHPRPGTEVGDLTVLQRAGHYPVGSFTLIHANGTLCNGDPRKCRWSRHAPFYLVRAPGRVLTQPGFCIPSAACTPPGGFYVLGWKWEDVLGGYRSRCNLRIDRRHEQFYCTNLDARWDRVGRVITRPPHAPFDTPLQFAPAKVAWDGHVLFAAGTDLGPPSPRAVHSLWP